MSDPLPTSSESNPNPTTEAYFRIGQVAAAWSGLERIVDETTWRMAGVEPRSGACVTSQVQSLRYKLFALISLCDLRGYTDSVKTLNKFSSLAEPIGKDRNNIVHTPVMEQVETGQIHRVVLSAERKLVMMKTAPNPQWEIDLAVKICGLINSMLEIQRDLFARIDA